MSAAELPPLLRAPPLESVLESALNSTAASKVLKEMEGLIEKLVNKMDDVYYANRELEDRGVSLFERLGKACEYLEKECADPNKDSKCCAPTFGDQPKEIPDRFRELIDDEFESLLQGIWERLGKCLSADNFDGLRSRFEFLGKKGAY